MDHSHHQNDHHSIKSTTSTLHDSMMKMYFHFGFGDTLLFKGFVINSSSELWLACSVFFIIAILYEGLKSVRERILHRSSCLRSYHVATIDRLMESRQTDTPSTVGGGGTGNASPGESHLVGDISNCRHYPERYSHCATRMLNRWHVLQSVLHMLQVAISYTLMLGFMSFNVCICFAILIGAGFGYFIFCWRKMSFQMATEHCH